MNFELDSTPSTDLHFLPNVPMFQSLSCHVWCDSVDFQDNLSTTILNEKASSRALN